jgi:hypothetical protein
MSEPETVLPDFEYMRQEQIQNSIRKRTVERVLPTNTIQHGCDVTFNVPRSTAFTPLHETMLQVSLKVTKEGGAACDHDKAESPDTVSVVNNIFHSIWKHVCVYLNGHLAESSDMYPFRAYMDTLTSCSSNVMSVRAETVGWQKDTPGQMDEATTMATSSKNTGAKRRGMWLKNSSTKTFIAKLHTDMFLQGRSILPNTLIDIVLTPSKDGFVLIAPRDSTYQMHITAAHLDVVRQHVAPSLLSLHMQLAEKRNLSLNLRRVKVTTYNIKSGTVEETLPKLFYSENALPDRFFVAFVYNKAIAGRCEFNPFNFQTLGIEALQAEVNGLSIPSRPYDTNNFGFVEAYHRFVRTFNPTEANHEIDISLSEYQGGYAIFAFEVVPRACGGDILGPPEKGNIALSIKFKEAQNDVVTAMILSEHRDTYEIRPAGDVSVSV